ncbi:hypothetical protein NCAS_0C05750 [Naumovozyma castellii]|uniref:Septin-type G domain-containing protein n=1 Tax=Naumovozyma castellii TaxID=27288 RepID=G0VDK3_NAUCA|nr:hypothetical protein NCAS_0C05750 [Naumovozyma castellii CBS 4309]CCC69565.1 hypothetical protein NCAS_0C05750 [Naumovozyma castellii CBS 4309]
MSSPRIPQETPHIKKEETSTMDTSSLHNGNDNGMPFPPSGPTATVPSSSSEIKQEESQISMSQSFEQPLAQGQVLPQQPDLKIIHRQINGYVGFANLPKQWHRKSHRQGFNLNILCVGQSGLGKSTLIDSLFNTNFNENATTDIDAKIDSLNIDGTNEDTDDNDQELTEQEEKDEGVKIKTSSTTIEENGVVLKLTVVDTPGYGDSIDNSNNWIPIIKEIDSRFDQYLDAENKIDRSTIEDMRIHACLYFIEPTAHFLKELDLEFCKKVHSKCNLIPIVSKSDILTDDEILNFKLRIKNQLDQAGINLFQPPIYKLDDDETITMANKLYETLPYAVVASTDLVKNKDGHTVRGRSYPWGVIEVDNSSHSDFNLLKDLLIKNYLEELRERTNNELYENYRSNKLIKLGIKQDNSVFKEFDPETRQLEEKQLHEAKLTKLETEMKSVFQQKVSEKEKKLQKSEADLFARHKEMKDKLNKQLKALEEKKHQLEISISNQMTQSPIAQKKKGFLR